MTHSTLLIALASSLLVCCGASDHPASSTDDTNTSSGRAHRSQPSASSTASDAQLNATSDADACDGRVYFDYGSASLDAEARSHIVFLADCIKTKNSDEITLEGRIDPSATGETRDLGLRRAEVVGKELRKHGVSDAAIEVRTVGDDEAVTTTMRWSENRVVDINSGADPKASTKGNDLGKN